MLLTTLSVGSVHITLTSSQNRLMADVAHATAIRNVDSFADYFATGRSIGLDSLDTCDDYSNGTPMTVRCPS